MLKYLISAAIVAFSGPAFAQYNSNNHYVQPHYRSNGSYVDGHHATNPNRSQLDNYSSQGNVNPYTGQQGHRAPRY